MTLDAAAPSRLRASRRISAPWFVVLALLAGWVCANRPQPLAYAIADWARDAATFSHHDRLVNDVRGLLDAPSANTAAEQPALAATSGDTTSAQPVARPNCTHPRPEWSLCETLSIAPPTLSAARYCVAAHRVPVNPTNDVPHPPPRASATV